MGGEVADRVIPLRRGVDDGGGMVGEASEMSAIFVREESFEVFPLLCIV